MLRINALNSHNQLRDTQLQDVIRDTKLLDTKLQDALNSHNDTTPLTHTTTPHPYLTQPHTAPVTDKRAQIN